VGVLPAYEATYRLRRLLHITCSRDMVEIRAGGPTVLLALVRCGTLSGAWISLDACRLRRASHQGVQ